MKNLLSFRLSSEACNLLYIPQHPPPSLILFRLFLFSRSDGCAISMTSHQCTTPPFDSPSGLTESKTQIPHAYATVEVDVTEMMKWRKDVIEETG